MKKIQIILLILIIVGLGFLFTQSRWVPQLTEFILSQDEANSTADNNTTNFDECVALGNPIMESYPRKCRAGDTIFTENIGNELEKIDLIRINAPRPNQIISNPLIISGEARGN